MSFISEVYNVKKVIKENFLITFSTLILEYGVIITSIMSSVTKKRTLKIYLKYSLL